MTDQNCSALDVPDLFAHVQKFGMAKVEVGPPSVNTGEFIRLSDAREILAAALEPHMARCDEMRDALCERTQQLVASREACAEDSVTVERWEDVTRNGNGSAQADFRAMEAEIKQWRRHAVRFGRISKKLDAVFENLRQLVPRYTGKACDGEPIDMLEDVLRKSSFAKPIYFYRMKNPRAQWVECDADFEAYLRRGLTYKLYEFRTLYQVAPAGADERIAAQLQQAVDAVYPIPNTPHTSVMQRATDNRAAFWRGATAARAIFGLPVKPDTGLTQHKMEATQ